VISNNRNEERKKMNSKITTSVLAIVSLVIISLINLNAQTATVPASSGGGGGGGSAPAAPTVVQPAVPVPDDFAPTLPITSQAVLLAEAVKTVKKVSASVYGNGLVYGAAGTKTSVEMPYTPAVADQPDFREMAVLVNTVDFTFDIRNPKDYINVNVGLRTQNGRSVFEGYATFKPTVTAKGEYTVPSPIRVELVPNGMQLLDIPGAQWAEVSLPGLNGSTVQKIGLERDEMTGKFLFNIFWAGQQNVMLTAFKNVGNANISAVYSTQTGALQPVQTRSFDIAAFFQDVLAYKPDTTVVEITRPALGLVLDQFIDRRVSPLVQVSYTKPGQLRFYAELPSGEVAKGFWVRRVNSQNWSYAPITRGATFDSTAEPGVYQIIIDWSLNNRNNFWGGDSGKG
jgi:hypothetical protein